MFHQLAFVNSAVYLWSIGECCCQGYSAIHAQGTIDDDSINLGQIQWGTLPGHAHITGVVLSVEAALYLYCRAHKAVLCLNLLHYIYQVGGGYVPHNQNNYDQKCNFSALGQQKTAYWAASEKNVVILSFTYSVLYCFLFGWKKTGFY